MSDNQMSRQLAKWLPKRHYRSLLNTVVKHRPIRISQVTKQVVSHQTVAHQLIQIIQRILEHLEVRPLADQMVKHLTNQ